MNLYIRHHTMMYHLGGFCGMYCFVRQWKPLYHIIISSIDTWSSNMLGRIFSFKQRGLWALRRDNGSPKTIEVENNSNFDVNEYYFVKNDWFDDVYENGDEGDLTNLIGAKHVLRFNMVYIATNCP